MHRVLKWFTQSEDSSVHARLSWFVDVIPATSFKGVDQVLYYFLRYCEALGISATRKYLEVFMRTEGKQVIKENNIRVESTEAYDYREPGAIEEAYRVISAMTMTRYDYCMGECEGLAFKAEMKAFMDVQKESSLQLLFAEMFPKLSSGQGKDSIITEMQLRLSEISEAYSDEKLDDLDFLENRSTATGRSDRQEYLFSTGIPCIDGDVGGVFTKQCWTFTGQPGSGKTRFALAKFVYNAAVQAGLDVLVDELELSKGEIEDILIAIHIVNLYKGKIKIPDKLMTKNLLDERQRQIYEAAKIDLFESGKYGKITIDTRGLAIETMKKKRLQFFKCNPKTKLWVIDYLGLMSSRPVEKFAKHLVKYEIIGEGIQLIKRITSIADLAALCLCQFNDEGIKACSAGKTITPGMVEGGHIIQRHSDYDIAMTMTEEQRLAAMAMLSTVKQRGASGFSNVPLRKDLSVSIFEQVSKV